MSVSVCVRARACVRARIRVWCVRACVRAGVRACVSVCMFIRVCFVCAISTMHPHVIFFCMIFPRIIVTLF